MTWTLDDIVKLTGGQARGLTPTAITGVQTVDRADAGQMTFIGDEAHARRWPDSAAPIALVAESLDLAPGEGRALVRVGDVDLALALVLEAMAPPAPAPPVGVHESAVVDASATLGQQVRIGPHCVIGPDAVVGDGAALHAHVTVMDEVTIGAGCTLWPGVVVRERCTVGEGTILHANVAVGADGFGYRPAPEGQGLVKIPQIGAVAIGRGCEIGAGVCIDRAKFGLTEIGDGCKIDNLVQIAHNCRLGRCVIIAGQTGLAGSVTVGDGVVIGGGCDIRDHLSIGAGAKIAGGAQVMNDVPAGETWAGSPAQEYHKAVREYAAVRQLPELMKKAKKMMRE